MVKTFKNFTKSKDGSVAILSAVTLVMIVLAVGIAIDFSRLTESSQKLKNLTDGAVLAVARAEGETVAEREKIFETYMDAGVESSKEITGYEYTLNVVETSGSTTVTATSRSKSELFFTNITGGEKFVSAESEVITGKEFIEVVLVLDISTSMAGQRIIEMQNSAKNFVETLSNNASIEDRISISVVPFGGTVRLPSELEFLLDPPTTNEHWVDGNWNGCLATEPSDYAVALSPNNRHSFVPDFTIFGNTNPACPGPGNELVGLSTDPAPLLQTIDALTLSDGTGTDVGMAWGYAMLDPRWRRRLTGVALSSPRGFNTHTQKIIVLMSDGGVTGQYSPLTSELTGTPPYRSNNIVVQESETEQGFRSICDLSKGKGVEIYTVGLLITRQDDLNNLQSCGTSASYNYESGLGDLGSVFQGIANSIVASGVRLSR
ncbi:MAG: VWA domain-containing protein [Litorimonas sp.]